MNAPRPILRFLYHTLGDADWNMAVDQAIAEATGGSVGTPFDPNGTPIEANAAAGVSQAIGLDVGNQITLRFYTWNRPTLSLGYFQPSDQVAARFDPVDKVRRSTGGGAILHDQELTYSLIVPAPAGEHGARTDLYRRVHSDIAAVLRRNGIDASPYHLNKRTIDTQEPFLCFQRRTDEDLIVSGYKILGSAQRRFKNAVLQHGSLLLGTSRDAPELPGLAELTSVTFKPRDLAIQIADQIADSLHGTLEPAALTAVEESTAREIADNRFASDRWWLRR